MKRILITGAGSYIGINFEKWLRQWPEDYCTETVDMRDASWRQKDFSGFDTVFHVAGIVHVPSTRKLEALYYKVNRDLAVETAEKAKAEGVRQFIFMSTMAVYGHEGKIGKDIIISKSTEPNPRTFYGKSKLLAEIELNRLAEDSFKVAIIRAPMVYGESCPGNYAKLEKLALKMPVFPMIENNRSMLHIKKLNESIKEYIDCEADGLFLPQDDEYTCTSLLVQKIAEENGKRIYLSKTIGRLVKLLGKSSGLANKVFGNLVYEKLYRG